MGPWQPPGEQRFGPERRLRARKQFNEVFREGRKHVRPSLVFYVREKPEAEGPPRLGLAVSRKVGKATVRHRVKRRVREIFRKDLPCFRRPVDVVVIARPAAADASYHALQREWHSAMRKAEVIPRTS